MTEKRFQNKVVLVTGASSGIGRAVAEAFAREGASVMAIARRQSILDEVVSGIKEARGVARALPADVTKEGDCRRAVAECDSTFGALDIVVNAAGIIAFGTIENTSREDWQKMFDLNVMSVFRLIQLALPHLIARRGNVVTVSSVNGLRSFPGVLAYCASKAAVDHLTRCAALELAPKSVRLNNVNPGVVLTDLHRQAGLDEEAYRAFLERSKTTHPLGRVGKPQEVAELVLFLASDQASWITSATVSIDGGRNLTCLR